MNDDIIRQNIPKFTWYSPVNFGNGIVAKGNFKVETNIDSIHFGISKWKFIVERNLPDIQGKRVLDIGCNNGLSCVHLARMGAREVYGIDSEKHWPNFMAQAKFVKEAMEWRCNTKYPITYIDSDLSSIPELDLGNFDLVTALCCIYYLDDKDLTRLLSYFYKTVDVLLIQCNTNKNDQIYEVHRRAIPSYIGKILTDVGYPFISYDIPLFYERPIVVASKIPMKKSLGFSKIDRVRSWIRSKI